MLGGRVLAAAVQLRHQLQPEGQLVRAVPRAHLDLLGAWGGERWVGDGFLMRLLSSKLCNWKYLLKLFLILILTCMNYRRTIKTHKPGPIPSYQHISPMSMYLLWLQSYTGHSGSLGALAPLPSPPLRGAPGGGGAVGGMGVLGLLGGRRWGI